MTLCPMCAFAESSVDSENRPFDIFNLPSINHIVLTQGAGYFPVLNEYEGELYAVYRIHAGHIGRSGALEIRSSTAAATLWNPPQLVVDSPADDRNPAVGITRTGRIVVGYWELDSYTPDGKYQPELNQSRSMVTWSDDLGKTWSEPIPINVPELETQSPYGKIIQLPDGTLLMNLYGAYAKDIPGMEKVRDDYPHYAYLIRSSDNGETWGEPSLILEEHNETALLSIDGKRLLAVSRSSGQQRLDLVRSEDSGRTWSAPMRLTGPNQHPADLLQLSNGWIILLYGDRSQENKVIRGMMSRDQGLTWDNRHELMFSRPVQGDFGYPSGVLLPDGRIAIMYYWAGMAEHSQDGGDARSYINMFNEEEFIQALNQYSN